MSDVAFKPLTEAEKLFKELVWNPGVALGEKALEGYVPFFTLPVIRSLEEGTINLISDWLYSQFVLAIDITAIKFVNAEHQAAYEKASLQLKIIAHESGVDSDAFRKATEDAKASLASFVHFGAVS